MNSKKSEIGASAVPRPLRRPPGLENLATADQLLVHQTKESLEVLTGFETKNKYKIRNTSGRDLFFAVENSSTLTRTFFKAKSRPFDMQIFDNSKNEVIHLNRPFEFCFQAMKVFAPPGTPVGSVEQEMSLFHSDFAVKDAHGDTVLRIEGPLFNSSFGSNVKFKIKSPDGKHEVGHIKKKWSGFMREAFSDADNFEIVFPPQVKVEIKAVLLGALFLIDMMLYEK